MSEFKVLMPKMGESVQEATITKWFVKEGDRVEEDDLLFEIATEKVDSEIPSPVEGVIVKILYQLNDLVPVGEVVALINTSGVISSETPEAETPETKPTTTIAESVEPKSTSIDSSESTRFYSPLVKSIAKTENVTMAELETIEGSGAGGRVQKSDLLNFLSNKEKQTSTAAVVQEPKVSVKPVESKSSEQPKQPVKVGMSIGAEDQIVEMDRVRKIIAEHMIHSVQVAPHVTSVVEADVTNLVFWRNKVKDEFQKKYAEKLTFMPVFTEAVSQALREFPLVNASVDGDKIIMRGRVNVGIAVSKPDGNLIVPVIKDSDQKNLVGITKSLNDLANRARVNKLSPDEIQGGTFTITNFGSFRNIIGTPIISQPQVAILATGSIEKKPAVIETPTGDMIAIRHKMFLSLSYDHRIIDGALGGAFLRRIADLLEEFDINRKI
jgi:2-oxoglutarate dehydrogenase E2 component (dihydrolipoamide succinyltransferase)